MPATRSVGAAAAAVSAPLVFSCRSCHSIVGDSFNFVWSSEEMNCITLNGAVPSSMLCPHTWWYLLPSFASTNAASGARSDKQKGGGGCKGGLHHVQAKATRRWQVSVQLFCQSRHALTAPALSTHGDKPPMGVGLIAACMCDSTYYVMTCRGCSNVIGRSYQTTAKSLDHIR